MIGLVRSSIVLLLLVKIIVCKECNTIPEYNTLLDLRNNDNCMNVDLVFNYLEEINIHGGVKCRAHALHLLSDHFGSDYKIPQKCSCQGATQLQKYNFGSPDGVSDIRNHCLQNSHSYREMYYQYFESHNTRNFTKACGTHHKVWSALYRISTAGYDNNSCQKDMIYHLKYSFEQHPDKCVCTDNSVHVDGNHGHTTGPHGHNTDPCSHYSSYNRLLELGNTDDCMSANSVWHYLDDLQLKDKDCRRKVQNHLGTKYQHATSQSQDNCVCHARVKLHNHEIHRMTNGSLFDCRDDFNGGYHDIDQRLFSNIEAHGCMNHNYLWPKLDNVKDYCNNGRSCVDCQQDLIVRAAIQFPTDRSDSCVCSRINKVSSTSAPTTAPTTPPSTPTTTPPSTPTAVPTTLPTTPDMVSATSKKVYHASTSSPITTQRPLPTRRFACNKLAAVEDIAKSIPATDPRSSFCNQAAGGSDDAYILSTCNMTSPATWRRGINVMADCQSGNPLIQTYTPISTFDTDNYAAMGAQSGIFLGCNNPTGIKIAVQKCNSVPKIVNIENGAFANNPNHYYVIV